jgi:hypothetical protein
MDLLIVQLFTTGDTFGHKANIIATVLPVTATKGSTRVAKTSHHRPEAGTKQSSNDFYLESYLPKAYSGHNHARVSRVCHPQRRSAWDPSTKRIVYLSARAYGIVSQTRLTTSATWTTAQAIYLVHLRLPQNTTNVAQGTLDCIASLNT